MKKMNNKRGFTLAELLIVVAIIAVLVAISIPIFTSQLAKARAATDAANIRAGYAEVAVDILDAPTTSATYYLHADGTVSTTSGTSYACKGASTNLDAGSFIGTQEVKAGGLAWDEKDTISYTYDGSGGAITIVITAVP